MATSSYESFWVTGKRTSIFKDVSKIHWAENAINAIGTNGISVGMEKVTSLRT